MQTNKSYLGHSLQHSLITLLIFAVVATSGVFYLKPLWSEVNILTKSMNELRAKKDKLIGERKNLEEIAKNLELSTEVSRNLAINAIPERFEEDRLIVDLTRVAQKSDLTLNGISFGLNSVPANKIKRVSLNINVTGLFGTFTDFLKSLEGMERKIVVKSIAVQTGQSDSAAAMANFNVTAETYFRDRI